MSSSLCNPSEITDSKDELAHGEVETPYFDRSVLNNEIASLQELVPKRNRFSFSSQNPSGKRLRLQKWNQNHSVVSSETFETSVCRSLYRRSVKRKMMKEFDNSEGVENIDANSYSATDSVPEKDPTTGASPTRTIHYRREKRTTASYAG